MTFQEACELLTTIIVGERRTKGRTKPKRKYTRKKKK